MVAEILPFPRGHSSRPTIGGGSIDAAHLPAEEQTPETTDNGQGDFRAVDLAYHEFTANFLFTEQGLVPFFAADRQVKAGDGSQTATFGRPDDCDYWDADAELPCWPYYRDRFDAPNAGKE